MVPVFVCVLIQHYGQLAIYSVEVRCSNRVQHAFFYLLFPFKKLKISSSITIQEYYYYYYYDCYYYKWNLNFITLND